PRRPARASSRSSARLRAARPRCRGRPPRRSGRACADGRRGARDAARERACGRCPPRSPRPPRRRRRRRPPLRPHRRLPSVSRFAALRAMLPRFRKDRLPAQSMVRKRSRLAGAGLAPAGNAGGLVYGLITIGALMAAESGRHESYVELFPSALVATLLYWLAHSYAELLGLRLATGGSITLAALVIAWLAGAPQESGVTAALRTAVVTIVVFELLAGIRAKSTLGEL